MGLNPTTGTFTPDDASVSTRVTNLMSGDNPLMRQARTAGLQTANARGLLNSTQAIQSSEDSAYRTALPIASQEAQQVQQSNEAALNRQLQASESALGRTQQADILGQQQAFEATQNQANRDLQTQIANWNLTADKQKSATGLLQSGMANYSQQYDSIMANTNMDATARAAQLDAIKNNRDMYYNFVKQMYNINLTW